MLEIHNDMDVCWLEWKVNTREKKGSKRFLLVFEVMDTRKQYYYSLKINKVVEKKMESNFHLSSFQHYSCQAFRETKKSSFIELCKIQTANLISCF